MPLRDEFDIRFEEPASSDGYLPPDDPLGELSRVELGLRRFCFEQNRWIAVQLGSDVKRVLLYPDISMMLDELPDELERVRRGEAAELDFSDQCFGVALQPSGEGIEATLRAFGTSVLVTKYAVTRDQVTARLERFLDEVVQRAIAGGYVDAQEVRAHVARS